MDLASRDHQRTRIALAPAHSSYNSFIDRFAESIASGGYEVVDFRWNPLRLAGVALVILHWPNEFFAARAGAESLKAAMKLQLLRSLRRLGGLRVVWVAHNARPHDSVFAAPALTQRFLHTVDGVIYLSRHSRVAIRSCYRLRPSTLELVSAHGHYRDGSSPDPPVAPAARQPVQLLCFGQVRPYKNVEALLRCAAQLPPQLIRLTIAGVSGDEALTTRLRFLAADAPQVRLALQRSPLSEAELSAVINAAHAVVLPYREILHSGAALYALSHNRPVLAPRLGSLPELQSEVGSEWLQLYDGPLTPDLLRSWIRTLREHARSGQPDLSAHDWNRLGPETCRFIERLLPAREVHPGPRLHL